MTQTQTKPAAKPRKTPRAKAKPALDSAAAAPSAGPSGKLGAVVALLRRPEGASLAELQEATGWQAHSVRGAIAGAIKRKLGLKVASTKSEVGRVYRIMAEAAE